MDLLKSMNRALKYIEENLTNDIDFQEAQSLLSALNIILKGCFPSLQVFHYRNIFVADVLLLQLLN
ncbi:hypothetical protein C7M29_00408 [Bacillus subtilis]|nr:hypothetical protein C7M29_00408 [Bacillus subtilis]